MIDPAAGVADARRMSPKVSVVIPVFNRPVAVRRAIESVLAQTCQDFEIVVVDDGSSDGTVEAIAAFDDPRITIVRHSQRRGGSAARNTGIHASSAEYVAFLDSDDEWLPTKLERQLDRFARSDARVALVYTGMESVYADGSCIVYPARESSDLSRVLLTDNVIGGTSVGMVRRRALDAIGGFDDSLPASQEMDLWLRLCQRFPAGAVPDVLVRVAKGDDQHRITASIPNTTRGRELFRQKHRATMLRHRVLHLHLRESGWWYLRGARDPKAARGCAMEAVTVQPLAPLNYVLLVATLVPLSWLDRLVRWKHQWTARLGAPGRAWQGADRPLATSTPTRGQRLP